MKRVLRPVLLLVLAAGAVLLFLGIRSNLRVDWFQAAVRQHDAAAVTRLLAQDPTLISTQVLPQGSRSTSGQIRWGGRLPIHVVAGDMADEAVAVAEAMFAAGADFKDRLEGDTALHLAAETGLLPMITLLIDKGLDVNARNGCEHPPEALCRTGQFGGWQPFDRQRAGGTV